MSFKLGNYDIDVVGKIEQKRIEYPTCDEQGNEVVAEKGSYTKATYKNKEGVVLSKTYKLINGKPFDKFKKTEKVNVFSEVPRTEVYDMIIECFYLCRNEELRKRLEKEDKAIKFIYSCGNGYKCYIAYLFPFQNKLLMVCGFGSLSKQIAELEERKGKVEEVSSSVAVANPEELLLAEIKM